MPVVDGRLCPTGTTPSSSGNNTRSASSVIRGAEPVRIRRVLLMISFGSRSRRIHLDRGSVAGPHGRRPGGVPRGLRRAAVASDPQTKRTNMPRCALIWLPSVSRRRRERGSKLCLAGPGSDFSEEPAWGCEPVTLEFSRRSPVSSRARRLRRPGVVDHLPVDDVGEASFQAPHRFHRRLAGAFLRSK